MDRSIYYGVLLGYLPNAGELEFVTYTNTIVCGRFSPNYHSVIKANYCYLTPLINQHVKIETDENGHCIKITANTHASEKQD